MPVDFRSSVSLRQLQRRVGVGEETFKHHDHLVQEQHGLGFLKGAPELQVKNCFENAICRLAPLANSLHV
jgi:hypothetical protein